MSFGKYYLVNANDYKKYFENREDIKSSVSNGESQEKKIEDKTNFLEQNNTFDDSEKNVGNKNLGSQENIEKIALENDRNDTQQGEGNVFKEEKEQISHPFEEEKEEKEEKEKIPPPGLPVRKRKRVLNWVEI